MWYHLNNLKNVKNTHGGMLLLVLKVAPLHGCFSGGIEKISIMKRVKLKNNINNLKTLNNLIGGNRFTKSF